MNAALLAAPAAGFGGIQLLVTVFFIIATIVLLLELRSGASTTRCVVLSVAQILFPGVALLLYLWLRVRESRTGRRFH